MFENGDRVRKIGSEKVLTVVESERSGDLYGVQFENEAASFEYVKGSELELVTKVTKPEGGPGFVPKRSIMD